MSTTEADWTAMNQRQAMLQQMAAAAQRRPAAKQQASAMNFDYQTILSDFRLAMEDRGIVPPGDIIADGKMHRCDAVGRKGQRGAAYKLHMNGYPAGGFENHHDGRGWENWKADIEDTRTPAEKVRAALEYEENRRRRAAEARESQAGAKDRAHWILNRSQAASIDHPYLVRKQVPAIGLSLYKGALVVPMYDIDGELQSLQFIKEDNSKNFLKSGRVEGCIFGLGEPGETIYVVEGYGTAASVHLATGAGVVVAFNSGNLLAVTRALRAKYPNKEIVICADDDALNLLRYPVVPNAGLIAAYAAAREVGALVAVPNFPEAEFDWQPGQKLRASVFRSLAAQASTEPAARMYRSGVLPFIDEYVKQTCELSSKACLNWGHITLHLRDEKILAGETDFNDLQLISGIQAVRKCIERAAPAPALEVQKLSFDISF